MKNNKERKAYLDDVSNWKVRTYGYLAETRSLDYGGRTYVRVYVYMCSLRYDKSVNKLKEVKKMARVFQGELIDNVLEYRSDTQIIDQMKDYDNRMKKARKEKNDQL